jgi:hypothetical protein
MMLRVRFKANPKDPRPINWPIKHPYWITGYGNDHSIVVAYADNEKYITDNWPEATDLDVTNASEYKFTGRFPKPGWFEEE